MSPNRVVALATAMISLALALLPVLANLDWRSTAGIVAGIGAVLSVALKWLDGWQKHEYRQAEATQVPSAADQGDAGRV